MFKVGEVVGFIFVVLCVEPELSRPKGVVETLLRPPGDVVRSEAFGNAFGNFEAGPRSSLAPQHLDHRSATLALSYRIAPSREGSGHDFLWPWSLKMREAS